MSEEISGLSTPTTRVFFLFFVWQKETQFFLRIVKKSIWREKDNWRSEKHTRVMAASAKEVELRREFAAIKQDLNDAELVSKALHICAIYGHTPADLALKWESFLINEKVGHGVQLNLVLMRQFEEWLKVSALARPTKHARRSFAGARTTDRYRRTPQPLDSTTTYIIIIILLLLLLGLQRAASKRSERRPWRACGARGAP